MAEPTGLEPAISGVTGRRVNQLHHGSTSRWHGVSYHSLSPVSRLGRSFRAVNQRKGGGGYWTRTSGLMLVRHAL